jgi:hypothetical protein
MNKGFDALLDKAVMEILDGDSSFGTLSDRLTSKKMPYLTGADICAYAGDLGVPEGCWLSGASRWANMQAILRYCLLNGGPQTFFDFVFSKDKFRPLFTSVPPDKIDALYHEEIDAIVSEINKVLLFSDLRFSYSKSSCSISDIPGGGIAVETPHISSVDRDYLRKLASDASKCIDRGEFDSAITKSRTILEETFIFVIEKRGIKPSEKGKIGLLYRQVKDLYQMHPNKEVDSRVNELLSGFEKIVDSIAGMRNSCSDSHGVGIRRVKLSDYHVRLFVNTAEVFAEFILSVYANWESSNAKLQNGASKK